MSPVVRQILVAAKFLFAAKIMFLPYNNNTYIITILLCGERKFAATSKPLIYRIANILRPMNRYF